MSTKLLVKCLLCGKEYYASPLKIVSGVKCRECALKIRNAKYQGSNRRKTTQEFKEELSKIDNNIIIIGEYINARTHIKCKCKVCGNEWAAKPTNLISNKTGCPTCKIKDSGIRQRISAEEIKRRVSEIHPRIEVIGTSENIHSRVLCKCNICNCEWYSIPSNLYRGEGCPTCRESHGEKFIRNWLMNNNISFEAQKKFDDLRGLKGGKLPYDFYAPEYNCLIEYQGNFHDHTDRLQSDEKFEMRKLYDRLKKDYAVSHNYNFIEIWYFENIEEKLKEMFKMIEPVTTTAI